MVSESHDDHPSLPVLKFGEDTIFEKELRLKMNEYFIEKGIARTATLAIYIKALLILISFFTMYYLLIFQATVFWQAFTLAVLLGLSVVGIGVNLMHDGSHNAYSKHRWINRLMAASGDLIGASSYLWHWKHVRFHHTFTNISLFDTDIDFGVLGRLAPSVKRRWYYRYQHLYIWLFYCLLVIKWQLFDDFYSLLRGRLGNHKIPQPKHSDLVIFVLGKLLFFSYAFMVPLFFHPFLHVIFFYTIAMGVTGLTLSMIFILPHGVGEAEFPLPDAQTGRMAHSRVAHQIRVTVDFMRNNPVVTQLVGGLNHHREHHLFPTMSHVHYTHIAPIIDGVCEKFGVPHLEHRSYMHGLSSHFRWLRRMGRLETVAV